MDLSLRPVDGTNLAEVVADTVVINSATDGADLVGNLYFQGFDGVILLERHLVPAFFELKTGLAGEVLQKFSTYRLRLAIVGDFSAGSGRSLQEFIRESNERGQVSFVDSRAAALARLAPLIFGNGQAATPTPMDHHALSIAAFDQLAQAYQDKFMDLDLYDDSYDRLGQLLPPAARVLELGCGPGNITRALLRRRPDLRLLATDPAPNMLRLARQNNPTAECRVLDARALDQLAPRQFEAVVAGFCLPYLAPADTAQLLRAAHRLLTPGGVVYLSFIDDDAARSGFEASSNGQATAYVYYHPAPEVRADLAAAGFALVEEFRKLYPRADRPADTHCILLGRRA
ncbi:DUF4180 domain-containing protein [Hymenobacter edaphi]|uniref:DUF4180 domain-containing protein n=1 Tax=Hymenobacter edaphi TaxID=2211146 RepID=A0A328BX07_9BACT|nr:DUF4180 domain-containing protein [Hymenobacter edaphi]RAK70394.1 hypothetical protein DLM85_06025 [Hymenobacter edaphi]